MARDKSDVTAVNVLAGMVDNAQSQVRASSELVPQKFRDEGVTVAGVRITPTGLRLKDLMNIAQFTAVGEALFLLSSASKFCLGDWAEQAPRHESAYRQMAEKYGYEVSSLDNMASVCRRVPISLRNENLTFNHHVAVAKLDTNNQKKYLQAAVDEGLSVRALRERVNGESNRKVNRIIQTDKRMRKTFIYDEWSELTDEQKRAVYDEHVARVNMMREWEDYPD